MSKVLFGGKREVSNEEVIERMKYYIDKANEGMELYKTDKKSCLQLAKELRKELEVEYKNNSLQMIEEAYKNHDLFSAYYRSAVHESVASITGPLSYAYEKLFSFLYNVEYYMNFYIPSKYNND